MKTILIIAILLLITFLVKGQQSATTLDSNYKLSMPKDTVKVPYFISDRFDTIQVAVVLHKGPGNTVLYEDGGYLIFKSQQATQDNKAFYSVSGAPQVVVGALDKHRKRKLLPIILY